MTREQQKKLKEIRSALPRILQAECRQHKFKKKDYMVWVKNGDLFFTFFPFIYELEGKCFLDIKQQFKPMWIDDLLWDIIDMQENKSEPASLRSTGAFTVNGAQLYKEEIEIFEWSVEEVTDCIKRALAEFKNRIASINESDFYLYIEKPMYHKDIRTLLKLIHEQNYSEAIMYAESMEHDVFVNGGVGLREAAVNFCNGREPDGK